MTTAAQSLVISTQLSLFISYKVRYEESQEKINIMKIFPGTQSLNWLLATSSLLKLSVISPLIS